MDPTIVAQRGPLLACPELAQGAGSGSLHHRGTIATMGGRFLLPPGAADRTAAGVAAGDTVAVQVELDGEPRTVELPADLAAALDADPGARRRFDPLSDSHQRRHALAVEGARAEETRPRRVAGVLAALTGG